MTAYLRDKIGAAYQATMGRPIFPPTLDAITAVARWFAADELDDLADDLLDKLPAAIRFDIRERATALRRDAG